MAEASAVMETPDARSPCSYKIARVLFPATAGTYAGPGQDPAARRATLSSHGLPWPQNVPPPALTLTLRLGLAPGHVKRTSAARNSYSLQKCNTLAGTACTTTRITAEIFQSPAANRAQRRTRWSACRTNPNSTQVTSAKSAIPRSRLRRGATQPVAASLHIDEVAPGPGLSNLRSVGGGANTQPAVAASAFSTQDRRAASGAAPVCRAATCPPRSTSKVGMAWAPNRWEI
jgi:hypothetical protein